MVTWLHLRRSGNDAERHDDLIEEHPRPNAQGISLYIRGISEPGFGDDACWGGVALDMWGQQIARRLTGARPGMGWICMLGPTE